MLQLCQPMLTPLCSFQIMSAMSKQPLFFVQDIQFGRACDGHIPKPHERIVVLGIGGLGHLAVQYAKAAGFDDRHFTSPDKNTNSLKN